MINTTNSWKEPALDKISLLNISDLKSYSTGPGTDIKHIQLPLISGPERFIKFMSKDRLRQGRLHQRLSLMIQVVALVMTCKWNVLTTLKNRRHNLQEICYSIKVTETDNEYISAGI
jgi:hypothetical protein